MLTGGSVFSGIGLLDYGLHLAGIRHLWLCERDEWRRGILAQRWPDARVLDDVRRVGRDLPYVDLLAGGFPCKGASTAGKREGFGHPETVLWREMARAIRELRPRYVLVENVANILGLHDGAVWGEVLGDLAALGYDVVWDCLPAAAVGAPHLRDRVFAIASHPDFMAGSEDVARSRAGGALAQPGAVERALGSDRDAPSLADASSEGRQGAWAGREALGRAPARRGGAAAASDSMLSGLEGIGLRGTATDRDGQAAADPSRDAEGGTGAPTGAEWQRARTRAVDWGEYEPAIRRWERVHGPAPAPLVERVRGVDDRAAARVERARLSALGDGVQVQVGRIAGEYIIDLERGRLAHAA